MAVLLCITAATFAGFLPHVSALAVARIEEDSDCNNVVFDRVDTQLHVRTMVVEDSNRNRMLVLTAENDTSMPCKPMWWLDHNPQGSVQCLGTAAKSSTSGSASACDVVQCKADAANVQLGYVRTMLSSAAFAPQSHAMSAICIELGCRSRIVRTRVPTLLETNKVEWVARPHIKRMLIIGLGTSTMALWVRQQLPDTELHIAELVPGVAAAAPCFGLDSASGSDKNLHVHVGDGRAFLQESADSQFDVILVDAFDHDASLPPCFRTSEFFSLARKKLTPGGALSFNLYSDGQSKARIVKALMGSFARDRIWVGDAPGAQGIQEVITAFATGTAASKGGDTGKALPDATRWWKRAQYRLLNFNALQQVKAFGDVTECPANNTVHHG